MSKQPIEVAYLCLQATSEGQGSHAHVREMIRGLERRGYSVHLFEPRYGNSPGAVGRALQFARVQWRLMRQARRADALYVRAHFATFPAARWARRRRIPVIQEVNGPYEDLFSAWPWTRRWSGFFERLMRTQYQEADALVAVTAGLAEWLHKETGRTDVHVVPNGADIELFTPDATPSPGLPEKYVSFVGAFASWQGLDTLISAVREHAWPDDVSLVIAGDGAERPFVQTVASRDPSVVYLGRLPYHEVPGIIVGSLAGVSPQGYGRGRSATGLSPIKVFETLACGIPVIVTDFPGAADLVREYDVGYVVPPNDPKALAKAVAALDANPESAKAKGERGRLLMLANHSWDSSAAMTAVVLAQVLNHSEAPQQSADVTQER